MRSRELSSRGHRSRHTLLSKSVVERTRRTPSPHGSPMERLREEGTRPSHATSVGIGPRVVRAEARATSGQPPDGLDRLTQYRVNDVRAMNDPKYFRSLRMLSPPTSGGPLVRPRLRLTMRRQKLCSDFSKPTLGTSCASDPAVLPSSRDESRNRPPHWQPSPPKRRASVRRCSQAPRY